VIVQANFGRRQHLSIAGVPVGREISDLMPSRGVRDDGSGSIIVVVATDAPLLPHQLKRLAKRAGLGVGIVGGRGEDSSGDIFIAFSTANPEAASDSIATVRMLAGPRMNRLFEATVQATEEAIVNAMVSATTMVGVNGNTVYALPHGRVAELLRKYGRGKN
jgi:L-aminopeptidase/D-esterase-like protein